MMRDIIALDITDKALTDRALTGKGIMLVERIKKDGMIVFLMWKVLKTDQSALMAF